MSDSRLSDEEKAQEEREDAAALNYAAAWFAFVEAVLASAARRLERLPHNHYITREARELRASTERLRALFDGDHWCEDGLRALQVWAQDALGLYFYQKDDALRAALQELVRRGPAAFGGVEEGLEVGDYVNAYWSSECTEADVCPYAALCFTAGTTEEGHD